MKLPVVKRGMVQTALGSIFYLMSDGRTSDGVVDNAPIPILCFHMSPRSSDEYLEVLPLLAAGKASDDDDDDNDDNNDDNDDNNNVDEDDKEHGRVVIAFDIPGYGFSDNPPHSCTIDDISDACLKAADSILTGESESSTRTAGYVAVGSLLGNYCCVSLAARCPERIRAAVLTNPWYCPGATGTAAAPGGNDGGRPIPDSFRMEDDGSHLVELHSKRSGWLDAELNFRAVQSEMAYLGNRRTRYAKGIDIEGGSDYDFSSAVRAIERAREESGGGSSFPKFLCIRGEACATLFDDYGLDGTKRFDEACAMLIGEDRNGRVETLRGDKSTINVVNQMPDEFAAACNQFLSTL